MTDDDIRNIICYIINIIKFWKKKNMYILAHKKPSYISSFKIQDNSLNAMYITPVEDCIVDFGDGTKQTYIGNNSSTQVTHNYSESSIYTIKIIGNHSNFQASRNLIEIIQISNSITNCSWMFSYCENLTTIQETLIIPDSVTDCSNMFAFCWGLTEIPSTFTIPDSVTNCSNMFADCTSLTTIQEGFTLGNSVTDCSQMFYNCWGLTEIPSTFTILNSVTNCSEMFYYCESLTTIQEGFILGNSVTNCSSMFSNCLNLTSDISNIWPSTWNYTGTINISMMFNSCSQIVGTVPADKLWNSGKTFTSTGCFTDCTSLTNYDEIPAEWQ